MPSDYETNTAAGSTLNAWDGKQYTAAADKWHITDLLHYSGTHSATSSSINLLLKHSMAQLPPNSCRRPPYTSSKRKPTSP